MSSQPALLTDDPTSQIQALDQTIDIHPDEMLTSVVMQVSSATQFTSNCSHENVDLFDVLVEVR